MSKKDLRNKDLRVFIDMDGVVADWLNPAIKLVGLESNKKLKDAIITDYDALDTFVSERLLHTRIRSEGPGFWFNLEALPWADDIFKLARKYAYESNIAFLSKTGKYDYAPMGKRWWRDKHYPETELILAKRKSLLACEKSFLIDDCPEQIDGFDAEGGYTFKWPCQFALNNKNRLATTLNRLDNALKSASKYCFQDVY